MSYNIIVVDDDLEMNSMTSDFLISKGHKVTSFDLATKALAFIKTKSNDEIDLIVSDISMPEMDGLEFADHLRQVVPDIPVILVTAFGSIETAIEATKKGVFDYIVKPFKLNEFSIVIDRALHFRQLKKENESLKKQVSTGTHQFGQILGKSKAMKEIFDLIQRVAKAQANVLVTGDSGTGKELVAKSIHDNSDRKNKSFVAINCSAIPENLLESELFGHAKGSFTGALQNKKGLFEEAHGGTIFLDEIGDLNPSLQAKLLRVLQERKIKPVGENQYKNIDVRIIAATHKDLSAMTKTGEFREDLYYRLSVIPIKIPSLSERLEDVPLLANLFLQKYSSKNSREFKGFHTAAMKKIVEHDWPGNVRELENLIERVVVLARGPYIEPHDIPLSSDQRANAFEFQQAISDMPTLQELERRYIEVVLEKTQNRKEKAAMVLGINRRTLYRKEREYGLVEAEPHKKSQPIEHTKSSQQLN